MYALKRAMEFLPNIHPIGLFIVALTLVYRKKALCPLYVYVLLEGLLAGFNTWWIPYLYLWTILWAGAMLLPKDTLEKKRAWPCIALVTVFGLLYGTLYAPFSAIVLGQSFSEMLVWIAAGLSFDALHAAGNFALGFLIIPLARAIKKAQSLV